MQSPTEVVVYSPMTYMLWQSLPNLATGFFAFVLTMFIMVKLAAKFKAVDRFLNKFGIYLFIIVFVLGFIAPEHIHF